MIVVDASAILEVLLNTPAAARVSRRLFGPGETLHASHLLDLEVAHVLRRYCLAGELARNEAFRRWRTCWTFRSRVILTTCSCRGSGSCAAT